MEIVKNKLQNRCNTNEKVNAALDIFKVVMAILVIGIHTEPFGFNIWLDRGFGIITRLCVPFFFITSSYFYWIKDKAALRYIKRILSLYVLWSIIYLPFDLKMFSKMSIGQIIYRFFWEGNDHALWYLCGSIIGFVITYFLYHTCKLNPKTILIISFICLLIGCLKSTYAPLLERIFGFQIKDWLGSRNGLFYAFPYFALGLVIAKSDDKGKNRNIGKLGGGICISIILLAIESMIFVVVFKTSSTIIWLSVFPYTYFVFLLGNNINIKLPKRISLQLRKMSTLMYVSQYLFIPLVRLRFHTMLLFILVVALCTIFGIIIIHLSNTKYLRWLHYLY